MRKYGTVGGRADVTENLETAGAACLQRILHFQLGGCKARRHMDDDRKDAGQRFQNGLNPARAEPEHDAS